MDRQLIRIADERGRAATCIGLIRWPGRETGGSGSGRQVSGYVGLLTQFRLESGRFYFLGGYNSNSQMVGPSVASVMFRRTRWAVTGGNVASSVAPRFSPW